jgi:putative ATP-binding cassette transporter
LNLLGTLLRDSRKLLLLATAASVLAGLAGASLIVVVSKAIHGEGPHLLLGLTFFGISLGWATCAICSEICLLHATQGVILRLRLDVSRKILATPLQKLQLLDKPRLLAMITKDVDSFLRAFQLAPRMLGNIILTIACLSYMAAMSWQVAIVLTLVLIPGAFAYHAIERGPRQQLRQVRGQLDDLYRYFRDLVEGTKELQLNEQHGATFVERVIGDSAREFRRLFVRSMTGYVWVSNVGIILFYVVLGLLIFVVPIWLPIRIESLATVTLILLYVVGPISETMFALPILREAGVAVRKIEALDSDLQLAQARCAVDPFEIEAEPILEFQAVCHRHPRTDGDRGFILGPLDLRIRRGEILFVVGGNGSGKTTLALVLLGLYRPNEGEIFLNRVPLLEANRGWYRHYFSAVFSDCHVFEDLLVADDEKLQARARYYLRALDLEHKVSLIAGKFSTLNLSGGQRKRLALICCLLEDRPLYLFDEWAADQDPEFKRIFYTELLPELKADGKTLIVISHDDAYFGCADRVVKLADGQVQLLVPDRYVSEGEAVPAG